MAGGLGIPGHGTERAKSARAVKGEDTKGASWFGVQLHRRSEGRVGLAVGAGPEINIGRRKKKKPSSTQGSELVNRKRGQTAKVPGEEAEKSRRSHQNKDSHS